MFVWWFYSCLEWHGDKVLEMYKGCFHDLMGFWLGALDGSTVSLIKTTRFHQSEASFISFGKTRLFVVIQLFSLFLVLVASHRSPKREDMSVTHQTEGKKLHLSNLPILPLKFIVQLHLWIIQFRIKSYVLEAKLC